MEVAGYLPPPMHWTRLKRLDDPTDFDWHESCWYIPKTFICRTCWKFNKIFLPLAFPMKCCYITLWMRRALACHPLHMLSRQLHTNHCTECIWVWVEVLANHCVMMTFDGPNCGVHSWALHTCKSMYDGIKYNSCKTQWNKWRVKWSKTCVPSNKPMEDSSACWHESDSVSK